MEELLRRLIQYPTVTGDVKAAHAALEFIATFLRDRGMYITRQEWDGYETLVATTRDTKTPEIMLYAHLDVVAAPKRMFELQKHDGKYLGRGVYDMKSALAIYLHLVDELKDDLLLYDFGIVIVTDEEMGGKDGVSGFLRLLENGYVGKAYVMPDGGENWQLQVFEKGYIHYTLEAHGVTAHGSRPWLGENAVLKLVDVLHELRSHFAEVNADTDTFNVGSIQGGEIVNKVPHFATAEIEMRLNSVESAARLPALIESICTAYDVQPKQRVVMPPTEHSLDNPYIAAFAKSIEKTTGVKNYGMRAMAGSDARFLGVRGIPAALTYPPGGDHHGNNEWLDAEGFFQFYEIIRNYVRAMAWVSVRHQAKK